MIAVQTLTTEVPGFRMTKQEVEIWCLSAFHLRRWFKEVLLFTDDAGKEAAKQLRLPYTAIIEGAFGAVPKGFKKYYALAKLLAYRLMGKPFHHSDIDVIWLKAPPDEFLHQPVHVQCPESEADHYASPILDSLVPSNWARPGRPWNMGVFGGCNAELIRDYADAAIRYFFQIAEKAEGCSPHFACCVFEQFFLGEFLRGRGIEPAALLESLHESDERARQIGFRHFISGSKRDPIYSEGIGRKMDECCHSCVGRIQGALEILNPVRPNRQSRSLLVH